MNAFAVIPWTWSRSRVVITVTPVANMPSVRRSAIRGSSPSSGGSSTAGATGTSSKLESPSPSGPAQTAVPLSGSSNSDGGVGRSPMGLDKLLHAPEPKAGRSLFRRAAGLESRRPARVSHVPASETTVRAGRRRVRISNPGKLLFPADGITKADLAAYYAEIAPAMAPHARDRPLNLWRWNAGIERDRIVQQEIPRGAPDWVRRVEVPRRRGGSVCHAVGGEAATLVWLANQNCITPHAWTSRADRPDRPDRLVFDLDPPDADSDGGHFAAIRAGALELRSLLDELGLVGFAMTSGSRGLHVVAPLRRRAGADETRAVAGSI